ncbi:glycosyltransferase [Rubellimicrobium roseum]|nr:glycosyltransferase [Rubellimicrobium roseum]
MAAMTGATVIAPESVPENLAGRMVSLAQRSLTGLPRHNARPQSVTDQYDLFFYVAMQPHNLLYLKAMQGWREQSRKAVAFLFETWSSQAHRDRHYLRLLDQFDHVFLFNPNSVAEVQKHTSTPCSYLPAGVDVLFATPYPNPMARSIDVYGMGRTVETVHEQLIELTQQRKLLYVWDRGPGQAVTGFWQARLRTYHLIRNSRMFTSFNFRNANKKGEEGRPEEAIPARVFEGTAAGSILIGSAPRVPEFERLFDWPDALIEIPMNPVDMAGFYAELQAQPERLRRASIINAAQALRRHDWSYRLEDILRAVDLPVPAGVQERKLKLAGLADLAESQLGLSVVAARA